MFCLTALLEYKTALLEYIDLFVLDVLIYFSMIYCTFTQDLQSMVELKPHLFHLWSHTLAVTLENDYKILW